LGLFVRVIENAQLSEYLARRVLFSGLLLGKGLKVTALAMGLCEKGIHA
jgi:hypothetical protein